MSGPMRTTPQKSGSHEVDVPPESKMLKAAYKKSGLTVADLAAATGLSTATIHVAHNGIRYRDGNAKATVPPDRTLVKLSSVLGISPDTLRAHGRDRAAALLEEAGTSQDPAVFPSDREAQAAVAGRAALTQQILSVFSIEDLEAEVQRRRWADNMDAEPREG